MLIETKQCRIIPREFVQIEESSSDFEMISSDNAFGINKSKHSTNSRSGIPSKLSDINKRTIESASINKILEEKTRELEQRFQSEKELAFREGFEQGKTAALQERLTEAKKIEHTFAKIAGELNTQRDEYLKEAENILTRLSLEMAQTIIGETAMKASGDMLQHNLKKCLKILKGAGHVKIKINPIDYDFINGNTNIIQEHNGNGFYFEFEPDISVSPGGCHLETSTATADGTIESQFEILKDNFLQLV